MKTKGGTVEDKSFFNMIKNTFFFKKLLCCITLRQSALLLFFFSPTSAWRPTTASDSADNRESEQHLH